MRNTYATPSLRRGKKLLTDVGEVNDPVAMNKLMRYLKKQKPENTKVANLHKNDCLNSGPENIIFNSNNMILNENTLNSFFEKLAELTSSGTVMSSSQSTIKSEGQKKAVSPDTSFKSPSVRSYGGQPLAGNYMGSGSKHATQDINRVRKPNLR